MRRETKMKKGTYFIIQFLWSFILSAVIWYFSLKNLSFDFYGNSDDSLFVIILLGGAALYLVLTILYMIIGYKKVKGWKAWMIFVSLLISACCGFLGAEGAIYGSELINKLFQEAIL